ncbi:MAG: hypothetical protein HY260_15550, partial [Chloroflexi bacterium]|nr:hypothetical protein [Chloroflexota bacterium]
MAITIGRLDSFFTSLIKDVMTVERQSLVRLTQQRAGVNLRQSIYTDLNAKLKELQALVKPLTTTDPSSALTAGRAASVSSAAAGYTVLAASASNSAIAGAYAINVTTPAREHRVRADQQPYSDQALSLSGT